MPTINVETGTGATDSNSFVSLVYADTYHSDRGNTAWASFATASRESAIIKGGDYLNNLNFKGTRYSGDQAMVFPRFGLVDRDGYELSESAIPREVKYAQCEASLREGNSAGVLQPDLERGGAVKRKKVDVIETEWFEGAASGTVFSIIKNLLHSLLASSTVKTIVRS